MDFYELLNLNSTTPKPEIMAKFLMETEGNLSFYRAQYAETKRKYWLGKITQQSNWRRAVLKRMQEHYGKIVKI